MSVSTFACEESDEIISVKRENTPVANELSVNYRPFLYEFLDDMQSRFELIVYSSFPRDYLNALVNAVEKGRRIFAHRFAEEFCLFANIAHSVKCIDFLLANRSPADIIVLDTSAKSFPLSMDNVVPVAEYDERRPQDEELAGLARLLERLAAEKDVRETIRKYRNGI